MWTEEHQLDIYNLDLQSNMILLFIHQTGKRSLG